MITLILTVVVIVVVLGITLWAIPLRRKNARRR